MNSWRTTDNGSSMNSDSSLFQYATNLCAMDLWHSFTSCSNVLVQFRANGPWGNCGQCGQIRSRSLVFNRHFNGVVVPMGPTVGATKPSAFHNPLTLSTFNKICSYRQKDNKKLSSRRSSSFYPRCRMR